MRDMYGSCLLWERATLASSWSPPVQPVLNPKWFLLTRLRHSGFRAIATSTKRQIRCFPGTSVFLLLGISWPAPFDPTCCQLSATRGKCRGQIQSPCRSRLCGWDQIYALQPPQRNVLWKINVIHVLESGSGKSKPLRSALKL